MLRTCGHLLRKQTLQIIGATRLSGTDASAGSINAAHDKFAEREQALENAYFRKISDELLVQLRERHSDLEKQSENIENEQDRIEEQIKKLEKQKQDLIARGQKSTKP